MFENIGFVVYAVTDMPQARAFYEGVLGLTPNAPVSEGHPWVEYDIGSSTLAIGSSPEWKPSADGATAALEAKDFDAVIAALKGHNVPFMLEPQDFPTCHMAVIQDPDGNKLLIHKRK